jgi:hypothetical protein
MRLLARIVIVITAILLTALAYCFVVTQALASPKAVSDKLEVSGVYALGSDALQTSLITSLITANIPEPIAQRIVKLSVTPRSIETAAQPALIAATSWLTSTSASPLVASLDLSGIKAQIARQAKLSGSPEVGFVSTREVKDEIPLVDDATSKRLADIKAVYQKAVELIPVLATAVLVGFAILVLLAIRQPGNRIAWPAWAMLLAGGVIVMLVYGAPLAASLTLPKQSEGLGSIGPDLVRALVENARAYGYTLVFMASILLAVSMVVSRRHNKKDKKRR